MSASTNKAIARSLIIILSLYDPSPKSIFVNDQIPHAFTFKNGLERPETNNAQSFLLFTTTNNVSFNKMENLLKMDLLSKETAS